MNPYKPYEQRQSNKKELAEKSDTKIEDSHPYISELVEIVPRYLISGKVYRPISVGGVGFLLCEKLSNEENKNIIMIAIKRALIHFILIILVAYIGLSIAI